MIKPEAMAVRTAAGLPDLCYSRNGEDDQCVIIKRGVSGYYPTNYPYGYSDEIIDRLNANMGVNPAQRLAMEIGSMMGWHVPGADPARHVEHMVSLGRMEG
jgi:hypothetical protein